MITLNDLFAVVEEEQRKILELAKEQHSAFDNSVQGAFMRIQAFQKEVALNFMDGFQGTRSQNSMFSGRNSTGTLNSAFSSENSPKQIQSGAAKEAHISEVKAVKPKMVEVYDPVPLPGNEVLLPVHEEWQRFVTPDLLPRHLEEPPPPQIEVAKVEKLEVFPSEKDVPRTISNKYQNKSKTLERFLIDSPEFVEHAKGVLDYAAGILVLLNSIVMLVELELTGRQIGSLIGFLSDESDFRTALEVCRVINDGFSIIFFLEMLVRMALERRNWPNELANWFDALLAVAGMVDFFLTLSLPAEASTSQSVILLRLMRVMKSLRAIRMVRSLHIFRGLRLLVKACQCFLPSLCWSMVLLGLLMSMGSLLMGNLLQDYVKDDELSLEHRQWLWEHYGTTYRATYTLFEVTFSGAWPTRATRVLEVNQGFSLFFFFYVTVVVFAVIRVISAIFLKDTLDAAQNDAEQLVMDKIATKAKLISRLEGMFKVMDGCGTGMITEERLTEIMENPKVAAYFQTLDLDVHEGKALFHLLDNGDGEVTQDEFISGILRCKGEARAIEQVAMHSELRILDRKITKLINGLSHQGATESKRDRRRNTHKHLQVFRFDMSQSMSTEVTRFGTKHP